MISWFYTQSLLTIGGNKTFYLIHTFNLPAPKMYYPFSHCTCHSSAILLPCLCPSVVFRMCLHFGYQKTFTDLKGRWVVTELICPVKLKEMVLLSRDRCLWGLPANSTCQKFGHHSQSNIYALENCMHSAPEYSLCTASWGTFYLTCSANWWSWPSHGIIKL